MKLATEGSLVQGLTHSSDMLAPSVGTQYRDIARGPGEPRDVNDSVTDHLSRPPSNVAVP